MFTLAVAKLPLVKLFSLNKNALVMAIILFSRSDPKLFRDDVDIKFSRTLNSCKVPQVSNVCLSVCPLSVLLSFDTISVKTDTILAPLSTPCAEEKMEMGALLGMDILHMNLAKLLHFSWKHGIVVSAKPVSMHNRYSQVADGLEIAFNFTAESALIKKLKMLL